MKPLLFAFFGAFAFSGLSAQTPAWQPSPGHTQVPIWPGTPPDLQSVPGPETADPGGVTNVTRPTMTLYAPSGKPTGAAVVVLPGGGFAGLDIYGEGTEICDWLTSRGAACVLLKYRVPSIPYAIAVLTTTGCRRRRWRTRSGPCGWCALMPPSGASTPTGSA